MMYNNVKINEVLGKINEETKAKVQKYLDGKKIQSVKIFNEGDRLIVDAFIAERKDEVCLPYLEVDKNTLIMDLHCQCCDDEETHRKNCLKNHTLILKPTVMRN